jgi:hypothetical protein
MFTVATYASTMGIAVVTLQDQGGGLQLVSIWVRMLKMLRAITPTMRTICRLWPRMRSGKALKVSP